MVINLISFLDSFRLTLKRVYFRNLSKFSNRDLLTILDSKDLAPKTTSPLLTLESFYYRKTTTRHFGVSSGQIRTTMKRMRF